MNALVVSFDRLAESFLGCCGNGWIDTPNFDRLAAQSAVFHQHFAEHPAARDGRHAWWSGRYECRRSAEAAGGQSPLDLFRQSDITARLLIETDGREGETILRPRPGFAETVRGADGLDVPVEETPFFRLVARALRDLRLLRTSRSEPWLLWIKSRGVPTPWLAPRAFAAQFLDVANDDDDDQEQGGEELVEMSSRQFDDLLRAAAAPREAGKGAKIITGVERGLARKVFGGYVALLDAGLGNILDQFDQAAAGSPTLLIVAAAQGVSVRQVGSLTGDWAPLAEEIVHVPLFIRLPESNRGTRLQTLVQTVDLLPTLGEWLGVDRSPLPPEGRSLLALANGEVSEARHFAFCGDGRGLAGIRTSDHYLVTRRLAGTESAERRLFVKPEDIWELNDQAAQSPDLVEQLAAELDRFLAEGSHAA